MTIHQIKRRVNIALEMLRANDNYLLVNDVNERSITHKLAMYLESTFGKSYDVDCEYNRDCDDERNLKRIDRHSPLGGNAYDQRNVYPDIIVHKRGRNTHNLLVIEVKKSSSNISDQLDVEKLRSYTLSHQSHGLSYQYGLFIKFEVGSNRYKVPKIQYFISGEEVNF